MAKINWNFGAISDALQNVNNTWGPDARQRREARNEELKYHRTRNQLADKELANYDEDRAAAKRRELLADATKMVLSGADPQRAVMALDPNFNLVDTRYADLIDSLRGVADQSNALLDLKRTTAENRGGGTQPGRLMMSLRNSVAKQLAAVPTGATYDPQRKALQARLNQIDQVLGQQMGLPDLPADSAPTPTPATPGGGPSASVPGAVLDWLKRLLVGDSLPQQPGGPTPVPTPVPGYDTSIYSGL